VFLVKKFLQLVFVLLAVSFLAFVMLDQLEGDIVDVQCGLGCDEEQREAKRVELGLDQPVPVRYGNWLHDVVVEQDLGASAVNNVPVSEAIATRLPVTLALVIYSQAIALGIGLFLGMRSARKPGGKVDRFSSVLAGLAISIPNYIFAFFFILFFAVYAKQMSDSVGPLPEGIPLIGGRVLPFFPVTAQEVRIESFLPDVVAQFANLFRNMYLLLLPAICLALAELAIYARLLRNDLIATLQEDYVTMARAKGLPAKTIMRRHAFRPSTFSLATIAGINMGRLIGGTIIIETIFTINGMGSYVVQAISQRDQTPLLGAVLVIATAYVLINFAVDVLYAFLDPRIRHARATT
jgi:peptide/nickel transport system permease protein